MMILAPIAAALLQMSLSRSREYEADRSGAELLGTGEPLARALEKIDAYAQQIPMNVDPAHATAYIINPLTGKQANFANLFRSHPPTEDRIARLRHQHVHNALTCVAADVEAASTCAASVAEVRELERHAEVVLAQLLDRGLQVVALLAVDAQLVALHLVLHALDAETLDVLADLARLVVVDADLDRRPSGGRVPWSASSTLP